MEIKSNNLGNGGSDRIDFTRANRESLRENASSADKVPAEKPVTPAAQDANRMSERIKNARDKAEAQQTHYRRMSNMRDHFRASEAAQEKRQGLRGVNEGSVDIASASVDKLEVSDGAQELAETTLMPRPSDVDASVRGKRVSELKSQYESGKLDVESLVAETAYRMLGGE